MEMDTRSSFLNPSRSRAVGALCLASAAALAALALPVRGASSPTAFELRWYRAADPCAEVTDTPAASAYTRTASKQVGGGVEASAVASPASGTEAAPGAFLNCTAAAVDTSDLRFRFILIVNGTEQQLGTANGTALDRRDKTYQTAKLVNAPLPDVPVYGFKVRVERLKGNGFDETTPVLIVDPREQLRHELTGLGYTSGTQDPIGVFQSGFGSLLNQAQAATGLPVTSPAIRNDEWAQQTVPPSGPLSAAGEMRGEFYALVLNALTGGIHEDDSANLAAALPVGIPPLYSPSEALSGKVLGVEYLFPRYANPSRPDFQEFDLPDQFFVFQALGGLRSASESSFQPPAPDSPPGFDERHQRNLADAARVFNQRTAPLFRGGTPLGSPNVEHQPDVPRVVVLAGVNDGVSVPVVCWTFSHPDSRESQTRVKVTLDNAVVVDANDARSHQPLPGVSQGVHVLTVQVFDELGQSTQRSVQFRKP
jgi:hypothetical protein